MELKHFYVIKHIFDSFLLIVPYGIETTISDPRKPLILLLIVPYGIETYVVGHIDVIFTVLLIVPYGIETYLL